MAIGPGSTVGSYEVLECLGTGGMASVFRARHTALGSMHALKVLRSDLVANAAIRRRFLDEGRVQAQMKHPGIVRVTDLVSEPGVAGLVMDLLDGEPLDVVVGRGTVAVGRACAWMCEALDAVGAAHRHGVIHRDLKPSNLFVLASGPLCVLDFGIAKVSGSAVTMVDETVGTYAYMSPEQVENASSVDERSDVFSLGVVLYELLNGRPAFEDTSDFLTLKRIADGDPHPCDSHVPEGLRVAIERALAREASERFASCAAFRSAIEPYADSPLPVTASTLQSLQMGTGVSATWTDSPPPMVDAEVVEVEVVEDVAPLVLAEPERAGPPVVVVHEERSVGWLRERHAAAVRVSGVAQVLSGLLNTFGLWMIMCWGIPNIVTTVLSAIGMPGIVVGAGYLTCLLGPALLVVGIIELVVGTRAIMEGPRARGLVQRTAMIQVASVAAGGLPSALVGLLISILLVYVREPELQPGERPR